MRSLRSIVGAGLVGAALAALAALAGCGGANPAIDQRAVGSPCTQSTQCVGFCDLNLPGGYCERDCHGDADCAPGGVCVTESDGASCHRACASVSDCRGAEGYACSPPPPSGAGFASRAYCTVAEPADGGPGSG